MVITVRENFAETFGFIKKWAGSNFISLMLLIILSGVFFFGSIQTRPIETANIIFTTDMVMLILLGIVFGFLLTGFLVRVYRGGEIKFDNWAELFIDGILASIISFVYLAIPYILCFILTGKMITAFYTLSDISIVLEMVAENQAFPAVYCLVNLILFFFVIFMRAAILAFAKDKIFGSAFSRKRVFGIIRNIGWKNYLVNMILFTAVFGIIWFIGILVPYGLLLAVFYPLLLLFEGRYFSNLYDSAEVSP